MKVFTACLLVALAILGANSERILTRSKNGVKEVLTPKWDKQDWWESAVFYQIYPRSYKDSNNDGIGDLQGIISKLDHLADAGVTAAWLSPIFKSPQVDQGYDISDYLQIEPDYGTLDDLKELLNKAHKLGLKIILDFVPNHTSDQHEWFQNSIKKVEGFEDFYVWRNGSVDKDGNMVPPNNWISVFQGSAWTWNEDRQQFYFHQFAPAQPDLNYRNPAVVQAMKDVLTYRMDIGVDGFRIDAVPYIFEIEDLRDEPPANNNLNPGDYDYLDHIYTKDQDETFELIYEWRDHLDNYTLTNKVETKIMMTEAYTSFENTIRYFGYQNENETRLGAHFSFNFDFITNLRQDSDWTQLDALILQWVGSTPDFVTYNWVLGNHDNHRVATRLGVKHIDAYNMLTSILRGVAVTYNGEEIGQENGEVTCKEGQDPAAIKNCSTFDQVSRDFERTPFQWDSTVNAGFNEGAKPWLPVSKKANETNLAKQNVKGLNSHYNIYKSLMQLRKEILSYEQNESLGVHEFEFGGGANNVFHCERNFYDPNLDLVASFLYVFNMGDQTQFVTEIKNDNLPNNYQVTIAATNSQYNVGDVLDIANITLNGHESLIAKVII